MPKPEIDCLIGLVEQVHFFLPESGGQQDCEPAQRDVSFEMRVYTAPDGEEQEENAKVLQALVE